MNHQTHASGLDMLGAWLLLAWAVAMALGLVVLWRAGRGGRTGRGLLLGCSTVVALGLVGQVVHMVEHVVQIGYWTQTPNAPIRMTPWGMGMGRAFGAVDRGKPALGMELLHLVGNLIFLAGLLGVVLLTRNAPEARTRRTGRIGAWVQFAHCVEHASLTLSVWFGARAPIGLSTWFGTLPAGPGLWTYRVWWHFWANAIPTGLFLTAAGQAWRERRMLEESYGAVPAARTRRAAVLPVPA